MKLEQILEAAGGLDFNDKAEWVAVMKKDGATEFVQEDEKGFPEHIYALKGSDRQLGIWNDKSGKGKRFSSKEGKQAGMRFEKGYGKTKRNLKKVKL